MSFSKDICVRLFREVNHTQQCIEGASAKILFWKKHAREVVHYWDVVFRESSPDKKLNLLYVANDVLQKSRMAGRDFIEEFYKVLPNALKHMIKHSDARVQQKIRRVVDVWKDRDVFGRTAMKTFTALVANINRAPSSNAQPSERPTHHTAHVPERQAGVHAELIELLRQAGAAASSSEARERTASDTFAAVKGKGSEAPQGDVQAAIDAQRALLEAQENELQANRRAADALEAAKSARQGAARMCAQRIQSTQATLRQLEESLAVASQARESTENHQMLASAPYHAGNQPLSAQDTAAAAYSPVEEPQHHAQPDHSQFDALNGLDSGMADLYDPSAGPEEPEYDPMQQGGAADQLDMGDQDIDQIANLVTSMDPSKAAELLFGVITTADDNTRSLFGQQMHGLLTSDASEQPSTSQHLDYHHPAT